MEVGPRVSVIGCSGAGKSWTASRIAEHLCVDHVELDALRHGPDWTETPDDEFRARVSIAVAAGRWVIDGNYPALVRDIVWSRATTVVWLDYPRPVVMRQVFLRSAVRWLRHQELWNGNHERLRDWIRWYHPIRCAWSRHASTRAFDQAMLEEEPWSLLDVVRLATRAETGRWIETLR